jgi:hypothetical protein
MRFAELDESLVTQKYLYSLLQSAKEWIKKSIP